MVQIISKDDFRFLEIDREFQKDFVAKDARELSAMECFLLRTVGDAIREKGSENFWNQGCYSWFINFPEKGKTVEQRVFLTRNGILMFEDCEQGTMFRVMEA